MRKTIEHTSKRKNNIITRVVAFLMTLVLVIAGMYVPAKEVKAAEVCTRDDGVWLFPLPSQYWTRFSDFAGCHGLASCLLCGKSHSYNSSCNSSHGSNGFPNYGVDIGASTGEPVLAARGGYVYYHTNVTYAGGTGSRGIYAIVEHPIDNSEYSYYSLYQHLGHVNDGVHQNGSWVDVADCVGSVGGSGWKNNAFSLTAYGSHLHFEVFIGKKGGGQALANNVDAQKGVYYSTDYLKSSGIRVGAVITNPKNPPSGLYDSFYDEYHKGSITYTLNKNEVPSSFQTESTLRIDNHNPVGILTQGDSYTPSGVVRSNYTLRYCNAYIIKESAMNLVDGIHRLKDGASPEYASYNGSPGVSEYVLNGSSTTSGLHFENLSPGKYVFQVTAQDESEKAKYLVDEVFTVKAVQQDPKGWILAESNTCNTISVTGSAYYPDDMRKALDVHIYVGGPSGSGAPCYVSGTSRFNQIETDISVDVNGNENIDVYAYAINDRGGNNTFLGKETVNVKSHLWDSGKITKQATYKENGIITYTCELCGTTREESYSSSQDSQNPVIRNAYFQDYTCSDFTIHCEASDDTGIDHLECVYGPSYKAVSTYKSASFEAKDYADGVFTVHIPITDFNYAGDYECYLTAVDVTGNRSETASVVCRYRKDAVYSVMYNGHVYTAFNSPLRWEDAEQFAESYGGHLATITSEEENSILRDMSTVGGYSCYWLGANDNESEGEYKWVTGEKFDFSDWYENEPSDTNHFENCLGLYVNGKWNDFWTERYSWGHATGFIVEWDAPVITGELNYHEYKIYPSFVSWNDARKMENDEWYMATITSQEEENYVESLLSKSFKGELDGYYLGGTDEESEGSFRWNNGEAFSYTNWSIGQPDNNTGLENYIQLWLSDLKWNDCESSYRLGVIFEREIPVSERLPFVDVTVRPGNWAYEGIKFVYGKGLMSGSTDKNGVATFRPKDNITRAEFVTILYRMAGSPKVYSNGNPFTDVKLKANGTKPYYYDAVVWAKVVGVITGYPDGTFRTKNNITRADMAVTLMRYASDQGIDTSKKANITGMPDYSSVPKYARDAVAWANANGIITGREKNGVAYLAPREYAQRQECAAILQRFYGAFGLN